MELELDREVLFEVGMAAAVRSTICWSDGTGSTAEAFEDVEEVRFGERTRKVWGLDGEAMAGKVLWIGWWIEGWWSVLEEELESLWKAKDRGE